MEVSEFIKSIDILEYISQFCDLEEKNGEYWGLSPLKEENTPSFSVNQDKQCFCDFSSGARGNIITFIEKYNDCDYRQALEILKKYAGCQGKEIAFTNNRLVSSNIAKKFRNNRDVIKEVKHSKLDKNYMDKYQFNKDKLKLWNDEGITWDVMKKYEVMYDAFSDRIVYPIKDVDGEIISVCGRTVDKDFKKKGLRKYTYFQKIGTLDLLYGLYENKKYIIERNEIIIFEGAKSVMIADGWGIKNTVALLTSHLNINQMLILVKLGVRVVFALDEEVDVSEDKYINRLKKYVKIETVKNRDNILDSKMSPVDKGFNAWDNLYKRRELIN